MQLCITPGDGKRFTDQNVATWKLFAPSLKVTDRFPDNSVNISVDDRDCDNLTDKLDDEGHEYQVL